jgi:hypothetical protein
VGRGGGRRIWPGNLIKIGIPKIIHNTLDRNRPLPTQIYQLTQLPKHVKIRFECVLWIGPRVKSHQHPCKWSPWKQPSPKLYSSSTPHGSTHTPEAHITNTSQRSGSPTFQLFELVVMETKQRGKVHWCILLLRCSLMSNAIVSLQTYGGLWWWSQVIDEHDNNDGYYENNRLLVFLWRFPQMCKPMIMKCRHLYTSWKNRGGEDKERNVHHYYRVHQSLVIIITTLHMFATKQLHCSLANNGATECTNELSLSVWFPWQLVQKVEMLEIQTSVMCLWCELPVCVCFRVV